MKLLTRRALVVLALAIMVMSGLLIFTMRYLGEASSWVMHPANRHLYTDGQPLVTGTIYDRNGEILFQTVDGTTEYNEDKTVRRAVMHAVGDPNGNVVTGARVAFGERLSGWGLLQGAYRFNQRLSHFRSDLTLTLDSDLCAVAYNALYGRKGTVGVYNYKTGEILCMVSAPSFDPQYPGY